MARCVLSPIRLRSKHKTFSSSVEQARNINCKANIILVCRLAHDGENEQQRQRTDRTVYKERRRGERDRREERVR